ncbi:hypothetical protein TgHK011_008083 [Trichoderma gracile]|nr:hypothetical protein TgHK011_008083 [Trichoderma gracile]
MKSTLVQTSNFNSQPTKQTKPPPQNKPPKTIKMRAAAVVAIFAASAMAQTGGSASPTNGTSVTHTGAPTTAPTSGAGSLSQNILLSVGAAAVLAASL